MYQQQGKVAYKADLSNSLALDKHLNYPHEAFKTIHVAGTNGKGSTSHMLASILQEAGYKVGLYTSPHLLDFRERIKVQGKVVSQNFVVDFVQRNKAFFETNSLSFFEMTVGMAFDFFKVQKVDIAIIEVGLGGRLDSTNIITPEISVITNIGLDHTQFLGTTKKAIAKEKGGIIKDMIPVVIGEYQIETSDVFMQLAKEKSASIYYAENEISETLPSDLLGEYQFKNQKTALTVIKLLNRGNWDISNQQIRKGLKNVINNTGLIGRWQVLKTNPKVICDTAHNKEGLTFVMQQLEKEMYTKLHIVFGLVSDKDLTSIFNVLPKKATYYFCEPDSKRAKPLNDLENKAEDFNLKYTSYATVISAYRAAFEASTKSDVIFVGGSTFVVADFLHFF